MIFYHTKKPSEEVVQYYRGEVKSPSNSFDRLKRTIEEDGKLRIVTYSVSEKPIPTKQSWNCCLKQLFCCCKPSKDDESSIIGREAVAYLEKDLDALRPINKLKASIRKIIQLRLAAGMEKIAKHQFQGLMVHSDYWCEAIHPQHYAHPLSKKLFNAWMQNKEIPYSFPEWLQTTDAQILHILYLDQFRKNKEFCSGYEVHPLTKKNTPKVNLNTITIQEFNPRERKQYQVNLDTSDPQYPKFIKQDGKPLSGDNIFVIDPNFDIYATPKQIYSLHHSSFLGRGAVVFAGIIKLSDDGSIDKIMSLSGHYRPSRIHFKNGLKVLLDLGFDIQLGQTSKYTNRDPDLNHWIIYEWSRKIPSLQNSPTCPPLPAQNILIPPTHLPS